MHNLEHVSLARPCQGLCTLTGAQSLTRRLGGNVTEVMHGGRRNL